MEKLFYFIIILPFLYGCSPSIQKNSLSITIYDDGKACPGGCDAHVVFNDYHNGTINAYAPKSTRNRPEKCLSGSECIVCTNFDISSCITSVYRGEGPPKYRFDFTPSFFSDVCTGKQVPEDFQRKCAELNKNVKILESRVNCFERPNDIHCRNLMRTVKKRKAQDDFLYNECISMGNIWFNKKYKYQKEKQRSLECAYALKRKKLSNGVRYTPLLDGACRNGTYVGRHGFDCCSGNITQAASDFNECSIYYPRK